MEINGFFELNSDANLKFAMGENKIWINKIIKALEINEDTNSVLGLDDSGTQMGMFEMSDVKRYFHCQVTQGIIIPIGLNLVDSMIYMQKRIDRKGGYDAVVRALVIGCSLHKGAVDDKFLFQKQ